MARLPVFKTTANIRIAPMARVDNSGARALTQAGANLGEAMQKAAVQWQNIKNEEETLAGKNQATAEFDSILEEANNYSGWKNHRELEEKEKELLGRMNTTVGEVAQGFTNDPNRADFELKMQMTTMANQERLKQIFRNKYIDENKSELLISMERNKKNFVNSGNAAYKQSYLADLEGSFKAGYMTKFEYTKQKQDVDGWDYDFAYNQAVSNPENTINNIGNFGLDAKHQETIKEVAERVLKKRREEARKGRTEEEQAQIAMTQEINNEMFKTQWKENDGAIAKDMNKLFEYRNALQAKFANNELSSKDFQKLQAETVAPLLKQVSDSSIGNPVWWNTSFDVALDAIDSKVDFTNESDEVKASVYDLVYGMMQEKGIDPQQRMGRDEKALNEIAEKVTKEYLQNKDAGLLGVEANKVVLGTKLFDYMKEGGGKEVKTGKYQLMKDANGGVYKVYPDKDGRYTNNSIKERVR